MGTAVRIDKRGINQRCRSSQRSSINPGNAIRLAKTKKPAQPSCSDSQPEGVESQVRPKAASALSMAYCVAV